MALKFLTRYSALALLGLAGASSAANADVYWLVNGTFDDNTTLQAKLDINVYGYLSGWEAVTQADGSFSAEKYVPDINAMTNAVPATQTIFFAGDYFTSTLQLTFSGDLSNPANSPNTLSVSGASFECQASWLCGSSPPVGNPVRYLTGGVATSVSESIYDAALSGISAAPEPAAWIMMLLGFGGIGFALRGARGKSAVATA